MEERYQKDVRPLLDLVDKLRDIGINREVSLPQIVVMGDQSSGKSSVLQSISGIPFPRGSGLVTRCPLELIMKRSTVSSVEDWKAEISLRWDRNNQPPEAGIVDNIQDLMSRIQTMSEILLRSSGSNGFSQHSIVIKITSSRSPDLTLIDLPGIVRTTTAGQDKDVINQVNNMIDQYISLPNTIILAVIPSNQDIATVDILERAHQVDQQGVRTIGVLTKPDLIGPGSEDEVVQVLLNIRKPLRLGYIMVKNSSQKQLNDQQQMSSSFVFDAREDEKNFFANHPVFGKLEKNVSLFGIDRLTTVLATLLTEHIQRTLPSVLEEMKILLNGAQDELKLYGQVTPSDNKELKSILVKKINSYCHLLRQSSRGEYRDKLGILATSLDYRLHAQNSQLFKSMQEKILQLRPLFEPNSPTLQMVEDELGSQKGRELPGFLNTHVFVSCVISLVEEWRVFVEECSSDIIGSTIRASAGLSQQILKDYPILRDEIDRLTESMIMSTADNLREELDNLIAREQDPFTTQDVLLEVVNSIRFRTFDAVLRQILDSTDVKILKDKYMIEEEVKKRLGNWYMRRHGVDSQGNQQEMTTLIQAYWDIASRRFIDNVCMCIEKEFVTSLVNEVETQSTLLGFSMSDVEVKQLMREDDQVAFRRSELIEKVKVLKSSIEVLSKYMHTIH